MRRTAFLFPGQGAQCQDMGREFYEKSRAFASLIGEAEKQTGKTYEELVCAGSSLLDETEYTQPFLAAVEIGIARMLRERGVSPCVAAGLSLGEYSALASVGALEEVEAVRLCAVRGKLMQQATKEPSGMAAVLGMTAAQAEEAVTSVDGVYIANYNCPGQIVISGRKDRLGEAAEILKSAGAKKVIVLQVSGAFHSPYMAPAAEKLKTALEGTSFHTPCVPYISNCTAQPVSEKTEIRSLLVRQMTESVRWEQSIRTMAHMGVDTYVEIGPGRTLGAMVKKILKDVRILRVSNGEELEAAAAELV